MKSFMRISALFVAHLVFLAAGVHAQEIKVGVLPFSDATASGALNIGDTMSRLTQAEIVHSTSLQGRSLLITSGIKPEQLDSEKILAIGKENNVDIVVMGTLLEAHTEESAQNSGTRALFGQAISANFHSWKANVTLQADLYEVATGKKVESFRITQTQNDKKVGVGAITNFGTVDTATQAFQASTLGKALQKAVADLVKRLDADKSKLTLNEKPAAN
jgi:hypothetical protein